MADNQSEDQGQGTTQQNIASLQHKLADLQAQGEDYVRANPTPSFFYALGAGFILQLLPITALVGALLGLVLFAARPAIFIYGAVHLYKHYQQAQDQQQ